MTNKEAIEILKQQKYPYPEHYKDIEVNTALDLAIKALERDGSLSYDEVITSGFACPVCGAIWRGKE